MNIHTALIAGAIAGCLLMPATAATAQDIKEHDFKFSFVLHPRRRLASARRNSPRS